MVVKNACWGNEGCRVDRIVLHLMIAEQISIDFVGLVLVVEVNFGDGGSQIVRIIYIFIHSNHATWFICEIVYLSVPADSTQATARTASTAR